MPIAAARGTPIFRFNVLILMHKAYEAAIFQPLGIAFPASSNHFSR